MKLFNTMSRQVETLEPIENGKVKMYNCGLTVYSHPHIGNWLGYIYWDVLVRTLIAEGYSVDRTQNITDVGHLVSDDDSGEDKMEKGAKREGITAWDVAARYSQIAHDEATKLNILPPTHSVPATSCIDAQINFARTLDEKGYLYKTPDGMYFDTSKLSDYGKLARLDIDGLEAGERVPMDGKKRPTDFAVWKFSPANAKRDMEWGSPWGTGFPGWHLECSVIARETLGDTFDIHTGGIDHIPVHHTNEIAQTESLTGKPMSQLWLHNNHIKVDGQKMSKSLGNIYTLEDLKKRGFSLDTFRMLALEKHYQTEGNFTWEILTASQNRLARWKNIASLRWQVNDTLSSDESKDNNHEINGVILAAGHAAQEVLANNLDTPGALMAYERAFQQIENTHIDRIQKAALTQMLEGIDELLGFRLLKSTSDISDEMKQKIIERRHAREEKNWAKSDEIRNELKAQGIELEDGKHGTIWQRA